MAGRGAGVSTSLSGVIELWGLGFRVQGVESGVGVGFGFGVVGWQ